jgi:hypothetical protein
MGAAPVPPRLAPCATGGHVRVGRQSGLALLDMIVMAITGRMITRIPLAGPRTLSQVEDQGARAANDRQRCSVRLPCAGLNAAPRGLREMTGAKRGAGTKKPARSRLLRRGLRYAARALTLAFSRLLWRAALFLWMMPLSAIRSITGTAAA